MFNIIFWRYYHHLAEDRAMPYSPQHKRDAREKILESARRLFNRKGYSGASIEEIISTRKRPSTRTRRIREPRARALTRFQLRLRRPKPVPVRSHHLAEPTRCADQQRLVKTGQPGSVSV